MDVVHYALLQEAFGLLLRLPPGQQPWVYPLVGILAIAIVILIRRMELSRIRLHNQMKISQLQTAQLKKMDALRSQFFANISHELRTPITLIRGPLIQMMEKHPPGAQSKMLSVMLTNTNRLLQLIDQLLDLSLLDGGDYPLQVRKGPLISLLKQLVTGFASLADQKKISLTFVADLSPEDMEVANHCYFDQDVIEKIMNNILINAFKFTPEQGRVSVTASLEKKETNQHTIEIVIADTGIGIPEDKLPYIFDRFYQVDASSEKRHQGAGIGLAYVKELARVHHIGIKAASRPGQGTRITLRVGVGEDLYEPHQVFEPAQGPPAVRQPVFYHPADTPAGGSLISRGQAHHPLVLVIEDHDEVGEYIMDSLSEGYQVMLAPEASEGLRLAQTLMPDLIVSDIMMPGIDGIGLCKRIKNDARTSHIPVILLTARSGEQERILGLQTGSDDYLTKPFNPNELKVRVKNLIDNRRRMRERFSSNTIIRPAEILVTPRDQAFMENLMKITEDNLANEQFSINDLAQAVNMSQSQLHRKLKAVINQPANHFIRSVRMQRARRLLQQNAGNIGDVAYMVGFSDPGYFARIYKSYFGMVPSHTRGKED